MSTAEQKKIKDIATKLLKEQRSKDQVIKTLTSAGIVDKAGKIKSPFDQIFVQKLPSVYSSIPNLPIVSKIFLLREENKKFQSV